MSNQKQIKGWLFVLGMLFLGSFTTNLSAQSANLEIANLDQLCAGFTDNSVANLSIQTDTPFRLPNNAGLVFDWYADHENALKRWNTPLDTRRVPLPWTGEYNIWVVVKYINKNTLAPFDSFKSRVITINVEECPESDLRPRSGIKQN